CASSLVTQERRASRDLQHAFHPELRMSRNGAEVRVGARLRERDLQRRLLPRGNHRRLLAVDLEVVRELALVDDRERDGPLPHGLAREDELELLRRDGHRRSGRAGGPDVREDERRDDEERRSEDEPRARHRIHSFPAEPIPCPTNRTRPSASYSSSPSSSAARSRSGRRSNVTATFPIRL